MPKLKKTKIDFMNPTDKLIKEWFYDVFKYNVSVKTEKGIIKAFYTYRDIAVDMYNILSLCKEIFFTNNLKDKEIDMFNIKLYHEKLIEIRDYINKYQTIYSIGSDLTVIIKTMCFLSEWIREKLDTVTTSGIFVMTDDFERPLTEEYDYIRQVSIANILSLHQICFQNNCKKIHIYGSDVTITHESFGDFDVDGMRKEYLEELKGGE